MLDTHRRALAGVACLFLAGALSAQPFPGDPGQEPAELVPTAPGPTGGRGFAENLRPSYVLGPGDVILVRAMDADEINEKPFRVDAEGIVNMPLVGRIEAGGLTVERFEARLAEALKTYIRDPGVIVSLIQFRNEPVFLTGAFRAPGIYPLQGERRLLEVLVSSGGVAPNASPRIKLTRRADAGEIPLPNVVEDPDGKGSSVVINIERLRESVSPPEDIVLKPYDVLFVERAETVYVTGAVMRVGSVELAERPDITVAKLVAMSGGLAPGAKAAQARVLRPILDTPRRAEIPLDLRSILEGRAEDFRLMPDDILYVPPKRGALRSALPFIIPFGTAIGTTLIWVSLRR